MAAAGTSNKAEVPYAKRPNAKQRKKAKSMNNISKASASSQGYALAAPASSGPSWDEFRELQTKFKQLELAALSRPTGGRRSAVPGAGRAGRAVVAAALPGSGRFGRPATLTPNTASGGNGHFCWSHTTQGHLGISCTDPMPGHQPSATWANRMDSPCH